jgi:RHS repeat-associated protein
VGIHPAYISDGTPEWRFAFLPTSTYTYNLDGAMTTSAGESFSSIRRHDYTRLPTEITGSGGVVALRYDSSGRRLHKIGVQPVLYRNGTHHPTSYRTTEIRQGDEIHNSLVEHTQGAEIIYLFTPAGQTVTRRSGGYVRVAKDHISSVRAEISSAVQITAHYSTYGKSIISGGELRRAFAGYEPDAEVGLYNANRRLYAPTLRLFVSVDPRLQNASPYPYCGSDPFNNVDPTGGIASGIVSAIVQALVVIATVIFACATDGVGASLFTVEATADAGAEAPAIAAAAASTVGTTMLKGAIYTALTTAASNGADLIVKAAYGEHISAWQAVKSMIIEPLIAFAAGAAAGAVLAGGTILMSGSMVFARFMLARGLAKMLVVGFSAMTYSAVSSIGTAAVNNQLSSRSEREHIGIQMAISFGEAVLLEGAYLESGIAAYKARRAPTMRYKADIYEPEPPPEESPFKSQHEDSSASSSHISQSPDVGGVSVASTVNFGSRSWPRPEPQLIAYNYSPKTRLMPVQQRAHAQAARRRALGLSRVETTVDIEHS